MKKTILMGASLLLMLLSNAQQVQFDKADLKVDEPVGSPTAGASTKQVIVNFTTSSIPNTAVIDSVRLGPGSTYPAACFRLLSPADNTTFANCSSIIISLSTDPYHVNDAYIIMAIYYKDASNRSRTAEDTLHVANTYPALPKATNAEPEANSIMMLNAYNLEFGDVKLSSNYVGTIDLFAPNITKHRWGFNTGIMKINYAMDSGSIDRTVLENITTRPFDPPRDGDKYYKLKSRYKVDVRNTVWSFYFQPMFEVTNRSSKQHIYLHGHMEMLASKWKQTVTVDRLSIDSGTYSSQNPVYLRNETSAGVTSKTVLSEYLGLGVTMNTVPWKGGSFFFQYTVGLTSNTISPYSTNINATLNDGNPKGRYGQGWQSFYLARARYKHLLKEDAALVVGVEIRGLYAFYAPQYAAYAGLNLKLEKLAELLGFK